MTPGPGWSRGEDFRSSKNQTSPPYNRSNSEMASRNYHDRVERHRNDFPRNEGPSYIGSTAPSSAGSASSRPNHLPPPHLFYSNYEGQGESGMDSLRASGLPTAPRPSSISPSSVSTYYHKNTTQPGFDHEPQFRSHTRIMGGGGGGGGSGGGGMGDMGNHSFPSAPLPSTRHSYHHPFPHDVHVTQRPSSANRAYDNVNRYDSQQHPGERHHPQHPSFRQQQEDNGRHRSYSNHFHQRSYPIRSPHHSPHNQSNFSLHDDIIMQEEHKKSGETKTSPKSEGKENLETSSSSTAAGQIGSDKSSDTVTTKTISIKRPSSSTATSKNKATSNDPGNAPTPSAVASNTTAPNSGEIRESQGRKQNSACDACRNRKVRCHRTPGEERCNHCKAKGIECTTIYVQLATQGIKRPVKRHRGEVMPENDALPLMGEDVPIVVRYLLLRDGEYADVVHGLSYSDYSGKRMPPITAAETRLINATARQEFVSSLLETYFSTVHIRYPILNPQEFLQRFHYQTPELGGAPPDVLTAVLLAWGAKFSTHPIIVADRRETANDELTPSQRLRRSINNPLANRALNSSHGSDSSSRTGTGGSGKGESSTLSSDSKDINKVMGRSRIAEDLIIKAQEVLDRNKAHRIASMDNVKAAIIIQALFWQQASQNELPEPTTPSQLRPYKRRGVYICNGAWISSAISHMFEMRVHLRSTVDKIVDDENRNQVAMAWFVACMFDSHMSAFYRRKPSVAAEDYSVGPPSPPRLGSAALGPSPVAVEDGYRIWLDAAIDQCEMMRSVYHTLWTPCAIEEGISARKLEKLVSAAYRWRSNHLAMVGAPEPDWPSKWNFADAVTACSSDLNYHVVWILMWQAIDEYGIAELKATNLSQYNSVCARHGTSSGLPASMAEMELDQSKVNGMRNAIYEEALRAALRSADLSKMLSDFEYLQNEAGIMKVALCEAGYCLTRFQRPEVYKIIEGLRQYGQAFEECYEQADELERLAMEYSAPPGSSQHSMVAQRGSIAGNQGSSGAGIFGFSASGPSHYDVVPPGSGGNSGGHGHMMRNSSISYSMNKNPPLHHPQHQQHMQPQMHGDSQNSFSSSGGAGKGGRSSTYGQYPPGHGN